MSKLQILIIKVFRHQTPPLVYIQEPNVDTTKRRFLFGGIPEPTHRYFAFYKFKPFDDESLCPMVLQGVSRNKFLGITIFGPNGVCNYIEWMFQIIGIKYLLFAALDIPSGIYRYGLTQQQHFLDYLDIKNFTKYDQSQLYIYRPTSIDETNKLIKANKHNYTLQDPTKYINQDCIEKGLYKIYPISQCKDGKSLSYLMIDSDSFKWNQEKLLADGFPTKFIPDLLKGEFKWKDRTYKKQDYQVLSPCNCILILDLSQNEAPDIDIDKIVTILQQQRMKNLSTSLTFLVIHLSQQEDLMTTEYENVVKRLETNLSGSYQLLHIITDDKFYNNQIEKDINERDKLVFPNIQLTNQLSSIMKSMFPTLALDTLYKQSLQDQIDLDHLWKDTKAKKLLYRKNYTIEMDKGEVFFEKTYKLGKTQISFSANEKKTLLEKYQQFQTQSIGQKERISLIFLGTGATIPTLASNVQSFLIEANQLKIMVDCGSNTYFQLYCQYGEQIQAALKQLKVIFISHFHADHHQGLVTLLAQRLKSLKDEINPIFVCVPPNLQKWYERIFHQLVNDIFPGRNVAEYIIQVPNTLYDDMDQNTINLKELLLKNQLQLTSLRVHHCFYSSGLIVKDLINMKTICFSCDRDGRNKQVQNHDFLQKVEGCDVLVHECTFPDTQVSRAAQVFHSTFSQAIQTGVTTKAKNLILTHYSTQTLFYIQELLYQNGQLNRDVYLQQLKSMSSEITERQTSIMDYLETNTVFASDLMRLNLGEVPYMPQLSRLLFKKIQI